MDTSWLDRARKHIPGGLRECTVCETIPMGSAYVSHHGEVTCTRHPVVERCAFCCRPTDVVGEEWVDLGNRTLRCPKCSDGAIDDVERLRQHLPAVRARLAEIGFGLERRVKVRLVTATELQDQMSADGSPLFGVTRLMGRANGRSDALDISVLRGLPPLWFGRIIAHENMHAWLAEHAIKPARSMIEEGLCELAAFGWLKHENPTCLSDALRSSIRVNADSIYGDGFRMVQESVRLHGLKTVLAAVRLTQDLPHFEGSNIRGSRRIDVTNLRT